MATYDFKAIEQKWQQHWRENHTFKTGTDFSKPKFYVLDMFPYPSGAGLHVGHPLGYIASDIVSRFKRNLGFNVLHPMGYDAFGLPAEQYAIQTGQHPAITTEANIARYREQLDKIGFSFDWNREVRTCNPDYYKWTQWIFLQLFHAWYNNDTQKAEKISDLTAHFEKNGNIGINAVTDCQITFSKHDWISFSEEKKQEILMSYRLAYLSEASVWWCAELGSVLANDEVVNGVSERGGYPVERKIMKQWSLRISAYADRLLDGLQNLKWSDSIKESQRNWIGKSFGCSVYFSITQEPHHNSLSEEPHHNLSLSEEPHHNLSLSKEPHPLTPSPKGEEEQDSLPYSEEPHHNPLSKEQPEGEEIPTVKNLVSHAKTVLTKFAKENRKNSSNAVKLLWNEVRNNKLGVKFRREQPILEFIVDFVCLSKRLIIEVDGQYHDAEQLVKDENRTVFLEDIGFRVIRFTNDEVEKDTPKVVKLIKNILTLPPLTLGEGDKGGEDINPLLQESSPPNPLSKGEEEQEKTFGWMTMDSSVYLTKLAKDNRKNQTNAEEIFWNEVRNKKLGFKFRRQHPIHQFIADFVCLELKLIIEIDGEYHDNEQLTHDESRTLYLNDIGYWVIRFTNDEIENKTISSINNLKKLLTSPSLSERGLGGEDSSILLRGEDSKEIEIFTTRPDTIFGVSYIALAPEHELVTTLTTAEQKDEVEKYIAWAKNRSERERQADVKKITGIFTGSYVKHPFTCEDIPVWIADYVLAGYGTGAVMAVPAHDSRDYAFAKHFNLPIKEVVQGGNIETEAYESKEGILINSDFLNGLSVQEAIQEAIAEIEYDEIGQGKVNFRLRDAVFGRQRYWGEPIPMYYENGIPYPLDESELPLILPQIDKYLPTETGEPPLARATDWKYKGKFEYEQTTMPGWAGSSWYFLRYMDTHNSEKFIGKDEVNYWKSVDLYVGGSEHATGHLLYVRFWTKVLFDLGFIPTDEPAFQLVNQGMIQGRSSIIYRINGTNQYVSYGLRKNYETTPVHVDVNIVENDILDIEALKKWRNDFAEAEFILEDGKFICGAEVEKMSKRWYNVVNPDDVCEKYGADTFRMYEMFLGPLEQSKPWNTQGITGVHGFLKRFWSLFYDDKGWKVVDTEPTREEYKHLHTLLKKVKADIENLSLNTTVAQYMICCNELLKLKCSKKAILESFLVALSPFAPHICEELWQNLGHQSSISQAEFPEIKEEYLVEDSFEYPISINGKVKHKLSLPLSLNQEETSAAALQDEKVAEFIAGKELKKIIVVHGRIINLVIS